MKKQWIDYLPVGIRTKLSLILVLVSTIFLFRFGPEFSRDQINRGNFRVIDQITIDLIEITTQASLPSSPPKPRVLVRTLTDPIIDDTDLDELFDVPISLDPGIDRATGSGSGPGVGSGPVVRNPQRPPRVQRIVEPVGPTESVRVEIVAELTVGADGRVEDVKIVSIKTRNPSTGNMEEIQRIDEAYLLATREAAMQWQFRPATEQGNPVRSVSEHVFTFGRGIN